MAQDQRDSGGTGGAQGLRLFPPRMTRSQPQLATAYAPGSIFTWEGGRGACLSVPIDGAAIDFSARQTRRDQIMESLQEFCQNWLARGMAINRNVPVYEQQLLDGCFHNPMRQGQASVDIALDRFEFLRPERIGYLPGPLVYRCETCELVREYVSPAHQVAEPLPITCPADGGRPAHDSRWNQLDVVYAHWSGGIEGLSPYRYTMDRGGTVQKIPRCQCGAENFRLIKQGNQFSRWRFICTGCSAQKEVYQTDPFSLNLLKPLIDAGVPHQWSEINMIPVSYRASPVFYVQTSRFIVFDTDPEVITLMGPSREDELAARVASLHGFAGTDPSDARIKEQLERKGQAAIFAPYEAFRAREAAARAAGDTAGAEIWADAARSTLNGWYEVGLVSREVSASPALEAQVRARAGYARRYDPIRSTVEHDALRRRKVNLAGESAEPETRAPRPLCRIRDRRASGRLRAPRRGRPCAGGHRPSPPNPEPRYGRIFVRLLARVRDAGDGPEGPAYARPPHGLSAAPKQQAADLCDRATERGHLYSAQFRQWSPPFFKETACWTSRHRRLGRSAAD